MERSKLPKSIPKFVEQWATLPLTAWPLRVETIYTFGLDDFLIEPDAGAYPTQLCEKWARRRGG
ncbi:MAG TPA: hypothetical protein V6D13_08195 [Halomicronema sp.]